MVYWAVYLVGFVIVSVLLKIAYQKIKENEDATEGDIRWFIFISFFCIFFWPIVLVILGIFLSVKGIFFLIYRFFTGTSKGFKEFWEKATR